jgi:hypothetical protein
VAGDDGKSEIDLQYHIISGFWGLQWFKDGFLHVKQWTGKEMKEMEKMFVGVVAGAVIEDVTKCALAALDFIYYAQFRKHSDKTLANIDKVFDNFHSFKDIFIWLAHRII